MSEKPDYVEVIQVREHGWWIGLCLGVAGMAVGIWLCIRLGAGVYLAAGTLVAVCAYFAFNAWLSRPGSALLGVSPEGLTVRFAGRSSFFKWTEIERFGVAKCILKRGVHRAVGIRFTDSKKSLCLNRNSVCPQKRIRAGFDAVLLDNYGRDCAELAEHLEELRQRYSASLKRDA